MFYFTYYRVLFITFGIWAPPKYLLLYLVYLLIILFSYKLFDGYCFLTLLTNKHSGISETPLSITMDQARTFLMIYIIFTIVSILFPKYSLYNTTIAIIKNIL